MRYVSLLTGISTIIFFSSCGNSSSGETKYVPKENATIVVPTSSDTDGNPLNDATSLPNANNISSPIVNTQQPGQTSTVSAGLNPEHGKPGHNCDIAVGAPLNSPAPQKPGITTTPTVTNTPDISAKNATIVTSSKPVAAGMNPEHGKPGHRCDLAVGAPLNSKPAEVKTEQTPTPAVESSTPVSPLLPATTTPTTPIKPFAAGMNPEHGKPGHRCDIAVGDPLPKQ